MHTERYCKNISHECHTDTDYHGQLQASGDGVSVDPGVSDAFFAGQFGDDLNVEDVFTIQFDGRDVEVASYSIRGGR